MFLEIGAPIHAERLAKELGFLYERLGEIEQSCTGEGHARVGGASATTMKANLFLGSWRIVEMELWDSDYLDLVVPAHITLAEERMGTFQFGTVRGWIHYQVGERDARPAVEFSWEGENDTDSACGRGWAILEGDRLEGRLFIHRGDDSAFTATRAELPEVGISRRPRRRRR